jgi:putative transposase
MGVGSGYYQRKLPHWQPDGAALLTWRLSGSLPRSVSVATAASSGREFVRIDRELDAARTGPAWLREPRVAAAVVESIRVAETQLRLYDLRAWVIMPNHVHLVVVPHAALCRITKAVKGFSARKATRILGLAGRQFWQHESFDHWIRERWEMERCVRYVESNPVKAGLAASVEQWPWSSAAEGSADPAGRLDKPGGSSYA